MWGAVECTERARNTTTVSSRKVPHRIRLENTVGWGNIQASGWAYAELPLVFLPCLVVRTLDSGLITAVIGLRMKPGASGQMLD